MSSCWPFQLNSSTENCGTLYEWSLANLSPIKCPDVTKSQHNFHTKLISVPLVHKKDRVSNFIYPPPKPVSHAMWCNCNQKVTPANLNFFLFVCLFRFKTQLRLIKHKTVHSDLKPHKCHECGKEFREKGTLKEHERIHLGLMPFECEFCGKKFRFKGVLTVSGDDIIRFIAIAGIFFFTFFLLVCESRHIVDNTREKDRTVVSTVIITLLIGQTITSIWNEGMVSVLRLTRNIFISCCVCLPVCMDRHKNNLTIASTVWVFVSAVVVCSTLSKCFCKLQ